MPARHLPPGRSAVRRRVRRSTVVLALAVAPVAWPTAAPSSLELSTSTAADAALPHPGPGPGVEAVLSRAPAPVARRPAPVVVKVRTPNGTRAVTVPGTDASGIPAVALRAYRQAARTVDAHSPACAIPWTLLAAIGKVESDHGRYGGAVLGADGVSRPLIIGVALDGNGVARIADTDRGQLDGDRVWDRAVGPMQFIPSTWRIAGVDGDRNGVASPHDIFDATLAAASYLCQGSHHLADPTAMRAAILRYNDSDAYARLVMAYDTGYRTGRVTVAAPSTTGPLAPARTSSTSVRPGAVAVAAVGSKPAPTAAGVSAAGATALVPADRSAASARSTAATSAPTTAATTTPSTSLAQPPTSPPSPSSSPPTSSPPTSSPPTSSSPTSSSTASTPAAAGTAVTGTWQRCDGGYCIDTHPVDVGTATALTAVAAGDINGDGTVQQLATELTGLVGHVVHAVVVVEPADWHVLQVNGITVQ